MEQIPPKHLKILPQAVVNIKVKETGQEAVRQIF